MNIFRNLLVGALALALGGNVAHAASAFGRNWTNVFVGTHSASWELDSNWENYKNPKAPQATPYTNESSYESCLLDGNNIALAAGNDGYKSVSLSQMEGLDAQIGIANHVKLTIDTLVRLQKDKASVCQFYVDDTSKLIVNGWGSGSMECPTEFHVDAPEGIVFASLNQPSGKYNQWTCYLGEKGSIKVNGSVGNAINVRFSSVKVSVSNPKATTRKVSSRTLLSYGGKSASFYLNATVATDVNGTAMTHKDSNADVSTSDPIGTYCVSDSGSAIVIKWVEGNAQGGGDPVVDPSAAKGIIAINFNSSAKQINQQGQVIYSGDEKNRITGSDSGALDYTIPVAAWLQVEDKNGAETANVYDVASQTVDASRAATVKWTSANVWSYKDMTAKILNGYLDDSNDGAAVTVSNIPFAKYDVIFYAATDAGNKKFGAPEINGKRYTYASGETVEGDSTWGTSQSSTAAYGTNALRVNGLSGNLTVKGYGNNNAGYRGCIAAIVIVDGTEGPSEYVFENTDCTAIDSKGVGNYKPVSMTIPASSDLPAGTKLRIKSVTFAQESGNTWNKSAEFVTLNSVSSNSRNNNNQKLEAWSLGDKIEYTFSEDAIITVGELATMGTVQGSGAGDTLRIRLFKTTDPKYSYVTLNTSTEAWRAAYKIVAEKYVEPEPTREPTTIYWKGGDGTIDGATVFEDGEGNDVKYISGDEIIIDGDCAVMLARAVGTLRVKNGAVLQIASAGNVTTELSIDEGGTFDVNGVPNITYPIVLNGGTLANYGTAVGDGKAQFWNLEVAADSFIDAQSDFGTIASKYGSQEFKLGGNKLTKLGAGKFFIAEATFTGGGTLDIQEGAIVLRNGTTLPNNLTVKVGPNGETISGGTGFAIKSGKITFDISEALKSAANEITLLNAKTTVTAEKFALVDGTDENWEIQIDETSVKAINTYTLLTIGDKAYPTLKMAFANIQADGAVLKIVDATRLSYINGKLILDSEEVDLTQYAVELAEGEDGAITVSRLMEGGALTIAEICPKPTAKDPNGVEAGWVELVNIGTGWAELSEYSFGRFNRGKEMKAKKLLALPARVVAPGGKVRFYTTEGYVEGDDLMFTEPKMTADATAEIKGVLVYPAKVNPKKYPMVTLAKGGETICSVVIPCDTPDDATIIVEPLDETVLGGATRHYLKVGSKLAAIGPEVGPLYGVEHIFSDINAAQPAIPGEDYVVTFDVNPIYGGGEKDAIEDVYLVYRTDLDDATRKEVEMTKGEVVSGHGQQWTVAIPSTDFPEAGHLIQWKAKIIDVAGNVWYAPQFLGPDDGYEWYGTIVEPTKDQLSETLTTFHLFADAETADDKNAQNRNMKVMNIDYDEFMSNKNYDDLRTRHPYGGRIVIYDSSTSQYYDNVRIDLRGNSSKGFNKKSHGLRFGKTHPLSTFDCVSGETREIRKSSFIAEFGDPSFLRQMTAFWLFNKHGSPAPFHYPARLNLNGEFYQLGFHSERFTDELIEDCYRLDPLGYGYKNIGSFGNGTTAGGIEKKTPDDGNEADLSVLNAFCSTLPTAIVTSDADKAKYTKVVVEKMDLPAWINYMALTKITQECDDVWANLSGYYDNPQLIDGIRSGSTGTWRPLAYDMQLTFGQWHHADYSSFYGLMSNQDWFKSHPFYGGYVVRAHRGEKGDAYGNQNRAYEAIFQSEKFRRLFLRRVRTLMDEELGAPDTTGEETWQTSTINFLVQMRKMAGMMSVEAEKDHAQWGYCNGASNVNVWGNNYPKTIEEAMADIWDNYIVPRRVHLYETHAAEGHAAEQIGYGEKLIAGIPEAQTAVKELKAGFSAEYDETLGAVVIRSANDEAIDLSNWKLSGPVNLTLPEGTVIDMAVDGVPGEVYVAVDRRATIAAFGDNLLDQVIVANGTAGGAEEIGLVASDGTDVLAVEKSEQEKYLRLWGFAGAPDGAEGTDANEFIVFTNLNQEATLDASGAHIQFEKYGATPEGRCSFDLPAGTIIEAGGWVRFNQADVPWTKITDGFQEIVLTDAKGIEIEHFSNLDQVAIIGAKGSGKMAVHNLETDEWHAILITEAPGYEPPPPPPPVDLNWANTNVTEKITLAPGYTYNFANANFLGGLELPAGEYTIKNDGSTSVNTAAFVSGAGASITFVGKGRFELTGENITEPLFTAKDLYITKGTFAIDVAVPDSTNKVAAVSLSGNFGLSGDGKLDMTLAGNQPYGIELINKKMSADFEAGAFTATLGGKKASAFKFKGSDAVTLSGGTMDVSIEGTGAKVLNGGTIVFEDGYVCNVEGGKDAIDATVFESGKMLTVNGGTFDISVPGAGSQIFTTTDDPSEKDLTLTINGGTFNLLAGDDCVKSAGNDAVNDPKSVNTARNVVITGGNFYGVSLGNDVIDSNGDIIITGGNILAYTTAVEDDDNGSTGLDVNVGRTITVEGGNVIAIGGPNSSFHYEGGLAYTADGVLATDWSDKFVELDGKAGKFNTRVWAKIPELDVDKISLFFFTPGIDPAKLPTATTEPPSEEFATGFHDLYIDDVPPGELVITKICARCQPNVPEAKDLGWILLENVGGKPLELSDYKVYCVNRGKKLKLEEAFTLSVGTLGVGETFKVWTSESPVEVLPAEATPLYAKKINQKKYPMVRLYKAGAVQQTVLVPVDLADEVIYDAAADRRPTISPLYGIKDAPDPWQAFNQAKIGEDYTVTLPILPADMSEAAEDQIAEVKLIYQIGFGLVQTNETAMTKCATKDKMNGWVYTGTIPGAAFTTAGELVRFAVAITDKAGREFRAPSFQNPDDGYEWYGTIVEPAEGMTDAKVQTFYLFADDASLKQMDVDVDKQDKSVVPYNARVGIYDALTGLYYDNVRIDLRGNTTARFPKKSHGLRFSKAQPLSCTDPVTGTVFEEIRKTSFVADYMDPAYIRQSLSFWLFREAGAKAPYDYPVKLNLNGEFYQLAWNSNRFTDELIEDVYGLDPLGYAFKNCGTIQPGHNSSITTEKKTPDDENESDIEVEKAFENTLPGNRNDEQMTAENEDAKYTQNVVNIFDLPAWLNYMAMTRITSETDDTWSNISLYYDVNGTGTWMPLAYDCHLSFGAFFCHDGKNGIRADVDFFKSHPFYGGRRVQAHSYSFDGSVQGYGSNGGLESIYQSPKFRRLYLRRLRTLMDEILEAPGTARENSKLWGYIATITNATAELAAVDRKKWPLSGIYNFQNDSMNCWPNVASMTPTMGIEDLWNNYVEPRRVHLFETHSIHNTEKGVGYNNRLSAGIPDKQSELVAFGGLVTAKYDATLRAVVIRNEAAETLDVSGWTLKGPVEMTLPAGTILDQKIGDKAGELYVTADRKATVAAMEVADQVVVGNGTVGEGAITLTAANGTSLVPYVPVPVEVRLVATKPNDTLPEIWMSQFTDFPANVTLILAGEGENGFTYSNGENVTFDNLHLVFESGTHSFTRINNDGGTQFASGATPENPTILVKSGATLTITAKDLSGWNCAVDTTGVIRVNDGGTLNLVNNDTSTFFFSQQLYLDAGAQVNVTMSVNEKFRVNGGINRATPQIYMPPSDDGTATITMTDGRPFYVGRDNYPNCAIFVGEGSTLVIDGDVVGILKSDTTRELVKYGTGKLKITGNITTVEYTEADKPTLCKVDGHPAGSFEDALVFLSAEGSTFEIVDTERMSFENGVLTVDGKTVDLDAKKLTLEEKDGALVLAPAMAEQGAALYITEIMPKPTDAQNRGTLEGMDPNGLESGWVELRNDGDKWVDLKDYRFVRVNRKKATKPEEVNNFPSMLVAPHSFAVFYTSERYSNSADQTVSAFETGTFDGQPMILPPKLHGMMVWGDKVNPKKSPFVRLYYVPGGDLDNAEVIDTVIVPSDLPEGASIIVGRPEEGKSTARWICEAPTRGAENPSTDGLVRIGPNVGPLYEGKKQKKHDSDNEFARNAPPANPDEDYVVTFSANPVLAPTKDIGTVYRDEDKLASIVMVVRTDLDDNTLTEIPVDFATKDGSDTTDWGDTYTATIPKSKFPARGHLIQWKFKLVDKAGSEWTSPSYHNPDDGYEWYGTIVEPTEEQVSKNLTTWHMFADTASIQQMDVDSDKQDRTIVPNNARVAIYDASTSNYYDYVRIDLRGNTSASFYKKSHGLRFAKAHPLTTYDCVSGKDVEEIRKSSLIAEWADPTFMRQMASFWLLNRNGSPAPFDFPVRCNLNGEFFQLAFHSERFTDELIEDVYGFDKFGYSYKEAATWNGSRGEKKTPDDENESDRSVLQNFTKLLPGKVVETDADHAKYSKVAAENMDLAAWFNYMALTRITQETDDIWANIGAYLDDPAMIEGHRGTGTWRPLAYDMNLSFGQWYKQVTHTGLMADEDWFKCHPFYGGHAIRAYKNDTMQAFEGNPNNAYEAIYQNEKFRRLYLRRLRTLMDKELGAPNAEETLENSTIPFIVFMREMKGLIAADAALDRQKWGYGSGTIISVWPVFPTTLEAGLEDLWTNYVVPRREHLYVTHSIDAENVGYGSTFAAGIPHAQSAIADLRAGITAEYDEAIGAIVIKNANEETIDLSGWELSGPVSMTIPAGTILDQTINGVAGEVYVTADRRATIAAMTITDQVVVGNGKAGKGDAKITLTAADGTKVIFEPSPAYNFLRLHSFDGITPTPDGDTDEWITLTNLSNEVALDLAGVKVVFLKDGDPLADAKCVVTFEAGTTLAASESLTLKQGDYKWKKITNGKLNFYLTDADGMPVQSLYINQKDAAYKNYYGEGGPGGAFYLQATTFAQDSETFIEVAYPATEIDVKPGEPAEVKAESAEAAIAQAKLVVEVPEKVKELIDENDYKTYFKLAAKEIAAGKYEVSAVLNSETVPKPEIGAIDDEAEPLIVEEGDGGTIVAVGIVNAKIGLWYGFEATGDLKVDFENDCPSFKLATDPTEKLVLESSPREGASAFFRTKISEIKPEPPNSDE